MSAGQFDRIVALQSPTTTVDSYGVPQKAWATYLTSYAKLLQTSTQEFLRHDLGEATEIVTAFRIRWANGVTLAHQLVYEGVTYRLVDIREIGRRQYLDLKCEAITS